jgi:electron transfer flavoprotein beta subunit
MKLLVCISKTPDTTARIAFSENGGSLLSDGVQFIMNPYDEWFALVRALELKEQLGGTVSVINVGPASNDVIIRKALAIGADDGVRIDLDPSSAYETAKQIASYAKEQQFDIILLGKETIDYNGSEVGGMLAELLDLPFISFAQKMEMEDDLVVITRQIEGGEEVIEVQPPFVLSAAKGLAEQRIPNMRGIMMAKRKPLNIVAAVDHEKPVTAIQFQLPPEKSSVRMIDPDNMDELVRLLHEEAKII